MEYLLHNDISSVWQSYEKPDTSEANLKGMYKYIRQIPKRWWCYNHNTNKRNRFVRVFYHTYWTSGDAE